MHGNTARQRRMRVDTHMATEKDPIGERDVVTHAAVVRDVRACHQETVATNDRLAVLLFRATVDRDTFANDVAMPNDDTRATAPVAEILRLPADDTPRVKSVALADFDVPEDHHVRIERGTPADDRPRGHVAPGTDSHTVAERRADLDNRRGRDDRAHRYDRRPARLAVCRPGGYTRSDGSAGRRTCRLRSCAASLASSIALRRWPLR